MKQDMALSHVSRALGLAQSIEHPIVPLDDGIRAVASEIVVLLGAVRDHLLVADDTLEEIADYRRRVPGAHADQLATLARTAITADGEGGQCG